MIIRSKRVVLPDGSGGHRTVPADITIAGVTIVAVREHGEFEDTAPAPLPGAGHVDLLDVGEDLVTPAFVNAHTHVAMNAMRGLSSAAAMAGNVVEDLFYRVERHLQPGDVRAFSRLGAQESALAGVGVLFDHYYYATEVAEALVDVGLSGVVAPTLQDREGPGVPWQHWLWNETFGLADPSWTERGIAAAYGPHATDTTSDALWQKIGEAVRRHPLPIHLHMAQSWDEHQRSVNEQGCGPIERLWRLGVFDHGCRVLGVHTLWVSAAERRLLPRDSFVLGHCPGSQMQFAFPAPVSRWVDDGFEVALGTDCAASNDGMNVQGELRLVAGGPKFALAEGPGADKLEATGAVHQGTSPTEVAEAAWHLEDDRRAHWRADSALSHPSRLLRMVWDTPGNLHPALPTGAIAPGNRATIAIWACDHPAAWPMLDPLRFLAYSDVARSLRGLLVEGRWTVPLDEAQTLIRSEAWRAWRMEANERLNLLLARAGLR